MVEDVREALIRQWRLIQRAVPALDLEVESRVRGWRNREVLAHLALQPTLLRRFLATVSNSPPAITLAANLSGTSSLADAIDQVARGATDEQLDFAANAEAVIPALRQTDTNETVVTVQGPIVLRDYLVTRCIEAVVHGCDLRDPVEPDEGAIRVACGAFYELLAERHPELMDAVESLSPLTWLNVATGRDTPPPALQGSCPLMT